jgi:hypothetical protein
MQIMGAPILQWVHIIQNETPYYLCGMDLFITEMQNKYHEFGDLHQSKIL